MLLSALLALSPGVAGAQTSGALVPPPAEPYIDRLITSGQLKPLTHDESDATSGKSGPIRSLIVEIGASQILPKSRVSDLETALVDTAQQEVGISITGRYQTANYGLLGVNAQLRRGSGDTLFDSTRSDSTNASITLSSKGLPLGKGWLADSAIGMTSTRSIGTVNQQGRFFIPTTPLLGSSVSLNRYARITAANGTDDPRPVATVNLSIGEPGLLGGLRLGNFRGLSGVGASAGAQVNVSQTLTVGLQAIDIENTHDPYSVIQQAAAPSAAASKISSRAALVSLDYRANGLSLRTTALWSSVGGSTTDPIILSRNSGQAAGAWVDASYRAGRTVQTGGVYYFAPNLSWGTSAIVNNAVGGYYRIATSSQRWRMTLSLDGVRALNELGSRGFVTNADVRRQLTFVTSVGINSTFRRANGITAFQTLGFVDLPTPLGPTRGEAGWSHDPFSDLFRLGWNQTWSLPAWFPSGSRLTTQLSFDHRRQSDGALFGASTGSKGQSNTLSGAISGGATPFNGVTLDATIAYSSNAASTSSAYFGPVDSTGGALSTLTSQQGQTFSGTAIATVRLSSLWTLSASLTDARSSFSSRYGLLGLPTSPLGYTPQEIARLQSSSFRLRSGAFTLRYALSAGLPNALLGRSTYPVGGTGTLEGNVYLDGNGNGRREADEHGVPGVVVILDGIQAITTDSAGRYRFEHVADGPHRISVNADALPLPWSLASDDPTGASGSFAKIVSVDVRSTEILDIAAVRQ
ncbi:SdrD B-like domain-containing protein [Sphingomonas glacialis]|nr:SdrD B-like domain-containing protein [Sphingomonas glacialis]